MTRLSSRHEPYTTGERRTGGYHFRERSKGGVNIMRSCTLREHRRRRRNEIFCPKQLISYMHRFLEEHGKAYNTLVLRNCLIEGLPIAQCCLSQVQLNY